MTQDQHRERADAAGIRNHVDEIVASEGFARSKRLAGFLRWVVGRALAGDTESITERNVGIEVYGRASDFDPKVDGTVRAEAIRLRHKLREYYGANHHSRKIEIPKGSYVPVFSGFDAAEAAVENPACAAPHPRPKVSWRWIAAGAGLVLAIALAGAGLSAGGWWPGGGRLRQAWRLDREARKLIRIGDNITAADCARQAVALSPGDAEGHLLLSRASMNLNHDLDAMMEARLAQNLAPAGSEEADEAAAQRRIAELDTAGAVGLYRALVASHPHSFDFLMYLAQAEMKASHFEAAQATMDRARRLPEASGSAELDRLAALALGNLATRRPDLLPAALAAIRRARDVAVASGSKPALGRVMLLEGGLEANSGLVANSAESLGTSREICRQVHDEVCVASSFRVQGNQRVAWGQYSAALHIYEQALPLALNWQSRLEARNLLEGIEAATQGLSKQERPETIPLALAPKTPGIR